MTKNLLAVSHLRVGGVTNDVRIITELNLQGNSLTKVLSEEEKYVERDMSTILDPKRFSGRHRKKPDSVRVSPLTTLTVPSASGEVYHGGGLLPGMFDTHTQVFTPYIKCKRGFWGVRRLGLAECLEAKDWPYHSRERRWS